MFPAPITCLCKPSGQFLCLQSSLSVDMLSDIGRNTNWFSYAFITLVTLMILHNHN